MSTQDRRTPILPGSQLSGEPQEKENSGIICEKLTKEQSERKLSSPVSAPTDAERSNVKEEYDQEEDEEEDGDEDDDEVGLR